MERENWYKDKSDEETENPEKMKMKTLGERALKHNNNVEERQEETTEGRGEEGHKICPVYSPHKREQTS